MKRLNKINSVLQIGLVSLLAIMITAGIVSAVTSIGNNISTGGTIGIASTTPSTTLGLVGSQYLTGGLGVGVLNTTAGTITTSNQIGVGSSTPWGTLSVEQGSLNPVFVVSDQGTSTPHLLVDGRGYVGVGTTSPFALFSVNAPANTHSFVIGSSTSTYLIVDKNGNVGLGGTTTPSTTFGLIGSQYLTGGLGVGMKNTTNGTLQTSGAATIGGLLISSTNASSTLHSFGSSGTTVQKMLFGTCTPTLGSINASTTLSAICANTGGVEVVDSTDYKVFVTPYIINSDIVFVSASSTASGIQVSVFNTAVSNAGAIDPVDNIWSWMAIK